jgi:hypothetical protein
MPISGIDQISQGSLPLPPLPPQQQLPAGVLPPIPFPMPIGGVSQPEQPQAAPMQPPAPYDQSKDPNVIAAQRAADATRAAQAEIDARYKPQEDKLYADIDKDQEKLSALREKGPDQVPLPENTARHIDPQQMSDAFSAFTTLGALAGLLSKTPMTAALNNMTAAIKGVQEGDDAQYQRSYKEFQDNYKKAMATNKARLEEYNRIFSDTKITLDEKMREIGLVAAKHGDELTRAEVANQTPKGVLEAIKAGQKATENAQKQYDIWAEKNQAHDDRVADRQARIDEANARLQEIKDFHSAEVDHWKAEAAAKIPPSELRSVPVKAQQEYRGNDKLVGDLQGMKEALQDPVVAERIRNHGIRSNIPLVGSTAAERDYSMQGLTDAQKDKMQKYFTLESLYRAGEFDRGGVQMTKVKREILDPIYKVGGGYNTANISRAIDANIPEFQKANAKLEAEYPAFKGIRERMDAATAKFSGSNIQTFSTEADAAAAAKAGTLKPGTRIKIGGQTGTWQ